ncbi:hypothetical protein [Dysgonomonas sp. 25]|uniref:hypothetical protein n=1 Tax=Dysgonomonas sp. 25 TaxID=2302933 RepID=UPI0013D30E54|nr:hypothetical protein [Dysgonomonas sp. 25]NDV70303.1 hypothetical protein [Dysgonomonas sp. 25]
MKQISFLVGMVVFGLFFTCASNTVYSANPENKTAEQLINRKQKELQDFVRSLNEECPMDNGDTRYDKVEFISENEVGIFVSFVEETVLSVYTDEEIAAMDLTGIKDGLLSAIQTPSWSPLCTGTTTVSFCFSDNTGRELFRIRITPEDYLKTSNAGSKNSKEGLQEIVNGLNNACPTVIAPNRYDKVELLPDNEVEIVITHMKETVLSRYSDAQLKTLDGQLKKMLLPQIQSDVWAALHAYEITFVMVYKDKNGRQLFRIKYTPADYK